MWLLEQTNVDRAFAWLHSLYDGQHVDLSGAREQLNAAINSPDLDYFTQLLDVQIFPLARGDLSKGHHAVSFTYDALCVKAMRVQGGSGLTLNMAAAKVESLATSATRVSAKALFLPLEAT